MDATIAEAFDLTDRVAIVTGAGRGLGRAIASRLAEAGAAVVLRRRRRRHRRGDRRRSSPRPAAPRGPTPVDVTDRLAVDALVADAVARHGQLDVMVNNAAIIVDSLVLDTTEEDLDRVMAVNYKGVFFGCQAAGRVMKEQGSGSIINLASGAIDIPTPGLIMLLRGQGRGRPALAHARDGARAVPRPGQRDRAGLDRHAR